MALRRRMAGGTITPGADPIVIKCKRREMRDNIEIAGVEIGTDVSTATVTATDLAEGVTAGAATGMIEGVVPVHDSGYEDGTGLVVDDTTDMVSMKFPEGMYRNGGNPYTLRVPFATLAAALGVDASKMLDTLTLLGVPGSIPNLKDLSDIFFTSDSHTKVVKGDAVFVGDNTDGVRRLCVRYNDESALVEPNTLFGFPSKVVDVTPSESAQTISSNTDTGVVEKVNVAAISKTHVGSGVAKRSASNISVSAAGLITVLAGYYAANATKQLSTFGAQTITPGTGAKTVSTSGKFGTGNLTVAAIPSNYVDITGSYSLFKSGTFGDLSGGAVHGWRANDSYMSKMWDIYDTQILEVGTYIKVGNTSTGVNIPVFAFKKAIKFQYYRKLRLVFSSDTYRRITPFIYGYDSTFTQVGSCTVWENCSLVSVGSGGATSDFTLNYLGMKVGVEYTIDIDFSSKITVEAGLLLYFNRDYGTSGTTGTLAIKEITLIP